MVAWHLFSVNRNFLRNIACVKDVDLLYLEFQQSTRLTPKPYRTVAKVGKAENTQITKKWSSQMTDFDYDDYGSYGKSGKYFKFPGVEELEKKLETCEEMIYDLYQELCGTQPIDLQAVACYMQHIAKACNVDNSEFGMLNIERKVNYPQTQDHTIHGE